MQLFLKMRFDEGVKCVNLFFKKLGTSKKCETENGNTTFHVFLNLPMHGISCPVDARKLVLKFPNFYNKGEVERDVIIYDMHDQIIKNGKFSDAGETFTFLSENFRRSDAPPPPSMNTSTREKLIKINKQLDEILKQN